MNEPRLLLLLRPHRGCEDESERALGSPPRKQERERRGATEMGQRERGRERGKSEAADRGAAAASLLAGG